VTARTLVGREREIARLQGLLDGARAGRSGALLLHGEAGIGKTALLRCAIDAAGGFRVLRARGMESESDIPYAGLAELVAPLLGGLDDLPGVQAGALRGALALGPAAAGDRFTVPAALLSLLGHAAEERPVLAVIDDAQWLDEPSLEALLFAGRRLDAESVAMLGALRDGTPVATMQVPWLERLHVRPLAEDDARALLDAAIAPAVTARLIAGAGGNPLALLEIPRLLNEAQRAGREPLSEPLRPGTEIERAYATALSALPEPTRRALLVAAAADTRRMDALQAGLRVTELAPSDLAAAEATGIVALNAGELEFRHPLLRATVYHAATPPERRAAHAALAAAAPDDSAPRAWHLAACAVAPDERVAAALERAALDARDRGAHATAAHDMTRAAHLTPEPALRAGRLLGAAHDAVRGGEVDLAYGLLDEAAGQTDDPLLMADIERLRGHVEMRRGSPAAAHERLVREAERVRPRDTERAAAMLLEASVAHMITGDMEALMATAERARVLATGVEPGIELLATTVIGEAYLATGDLTRGDALLRACEPYLLEGDVLAAVEIVSLAGHSAIWIENWERAERILGRLIAAARDASSVTGLIYPLAAVSHLDFRRGRWAPALASASEAVELADDTGQYALLGPALAALAHVEASLGHEEACRRDCARGLGLLAAAAGEATAVYLHSSVGLLELGLGRIPEAIAALEHADRIGLRLRVGEAVVQRAGDLVEAYVRAGRREEAEARLVLLEDEGRRTGARWSQAVAARCRGLLAADDDVRSAFDAALALHDGLPMPFERARTLLALGERLRRARQRAEAREPLNVALETFERLGARPWAERARGELRATGQAGGRRAPVAADQLTAHELQIAVLVAQGMTNREAAAALFLSPKTIEYHLGQIYRKLDVRGRAQLARLMAMELPEGERDPAVLAEALS
jgi:DNA-binding CsgD family transcriptional regulator